MKDRYKSGIAVMAAAGLLVVGGTTGAVAAKMIDGDRIKDGTVSGSKLTANAVGSRELAPGSVGKGHLKDGVLDIRIQGVNKREVRLDLPRSLEAILQIIVDEQNAVAA